MRGLEFLEQLIDSMSEALDTFEKAKKKGSSVEAKKAKEFLIKLQYEIDKELQ